MSIRTIIVGGLFLMMIFGCDTSVSEGSDLVHVDQDSTSSETIDYIKPRELNNRLTLAQNNVHQSLVRFWDGETDSLRRAYYNDFQFELRIQQGNVKQIVPSRKYSHEFYGAIQKYFDYLQQSDSKFKEFIDLSNTENDKDLANLVNEITTEYNVYLDSIAFYQELFTSENKVILD